MIRLLLFACIVLFYGVNVDGGYIESVDNKTVIHVKVYQLPDPNKVDGYNRAEYAAVKYFVKHFPEIFKKKYAALYKANPAKYGNYNWDKVELQLEPFSGIQVEGVQTDLLAIAGGMAPDILYINFQKSDNYIQNGFLYPLDEYFAKMTKEQIDFRINSKLWPVIKRIGPGGKEHIWAMPYGGALGKVLLFRKDVFDSRGIPYPDKNWTWNDLKEASKKITDPAHGIYGILFGRGKHESWNWITFLWSANGEAMEYNRAKNKWFCTFDSPAGAEALDFYTRLCTEKWIDKDGNIRRGYSSKDASETAVKWDRGEIGMKFGYIDERLFATINPDLVGMTPVPLGPTGMRGAELNSKMMGLFSQIKDNAVRDAAWEYLEFYDSKEAAEIKTKVLVESGMGNFVNPKFLRMFGYSDLERLAPKGWSETFDIAIETGKPEPYGTNSSFAYQMMTVPIQEAEALALDENLPEDKTERLAVLQEILKKSCARANEEMIGIVTPEERTKRRITAIVAIVIIAIVFGFVFRKIIKAFTPPVTEGKKKKSWDFIRYKWAYLLLLPAVLSVLTWNYIPLFRGSLMSFYDYRILGDSVWVGLDNFGDVIYDGYWWTAVFNSFRYSFLVLSMTFLPPVLLAVLLQEIPKGKILFRTIFYLPAVITGLVTMLLWKQFFEPSELGMLNSIILKIPAIVFILGGVLLCWMCFIFARRLKFYDLYKGMWAFIVVGILLFFLCGEIAFPILRHSGEGFMAVLAALPSRLLAVHSEAFRWLGDPSTAMLSCVIPMVWAGMGPGCLIYLAALKGIPDDYYEAADIDGATFVDKILFVVIPHLKVLIMINFVGAFIASFYAATGNILVMTGGGANTEVAGLHIWYKAFTFLKFGPATAMAWMLGVILIGFTVHQLKMLSKLEFRTTGKK
ncbi:MAG: hypothetical protein A2017_19625 [Lentisphaerae bacterium GWF2_44_16]|nr:MAG: hypothetical protein A2017_19625 [Lentisphaerae bacterium GWF2_44_16]